MSEMLEKARKYEFIQGQQIKEEERPAFHITPYVGWMNDPNGFSYYKGIFRHRQWQLEMVRIMKSMIRIRF